MPQNPEPRLPKLVLNIDDDVSFQKIGTITDYTVELHARDGAIYDVTADAILLALDEAIFIDKTNNQIHFKTEGSGQIKIILQENVSPINKKVIRKYEFIVYDNFYKENYLDHFFSTYESSAIDNNPKLKAIFDTIMEFFDIFYAHREDIKTLINPRDVKTKYLNMLGKDLGFPRTDFIEADTEFEKDANRVYRELLFNLADLIELRGTPLSYELFFGALGYDVDIREYWYDAAGDLIEVHPTDPSLSTFYAYNDRGIALDEPQVARPDPRPLASNQTSILRNNKSNFIQVILSLKNAGASFPADPSGFSAEKRKIIKNYLEFLRPMHIRYITEILTIDLNEDILPEDLFDQDELDNLTVTHRIKTTVNFLGNFVTAPGSPSLNDVYHDTQEVARFNFQGAFAAISTLAPDSGVGEYFTVTDDNSDLNVIWFTNSNDTVPATQPVVGGATNYIQADLGTTSIINDSSLADYIKNLSVPNFTLSTPSPKTVQFTVDNDGDVTATTVSVTTGVTVSTIELDGIYYYYDGAVWIPIEISFINSEAFITVNWLGAALGYITDNTLTPPTEALGDIYILSHDGGVPNAAWDGASAGDIVEFNGVTWDATTPSIFNALNSTNGSPHPDIGDDLTYYWNGSAWIQTPIYVFYKADGFANSILQIPEIADETLWDLWTKHITYENVVSGPFGVGETITGTGFSATVVSDNGADTLLITDITGLATGTITGGTSGATATVTSSPYFIESIGEKFLLSINTIVENEMSYALLWDTFQWDTGVLFDTKLFFTDEFTVQTEAPDGFV